MTSRPSRSGWTLRILAVVIVIAAALTLYPASPARAGSGTAYSADEVAFVVQLNHYRIMNGLQPLKISDTLSEVSRRHSCDMARHDFFSHRTLTHKSEWFPFKANPWDRMDLTGYDSCQGSGEIIGVGHSTMDLLFDGFTASGEHRRMMLSDNFSVVGISLQKVSGSKFTYYWTVDFGGYEDPSAHSFTTYEQYESEVEYVGSWTGISETSSSGGSHYRLDSAGSASVTFNGTSLSWVAAKSSDSGIAKVTLDDRDPVYVDLYGRKNQEQRCVYSTGTLPDGDHTVVIEWTGTKNADASGSSLNVDAFDVVGGLGNGLLFVDLCDFMRDLYLGLKDGQLQL